MRPRSLVHLSPRELLDRLADLLTREREVTAELILYLAEVQRRRLHVAEGYPSMHAFCVGALGLSEDSAGKRIRVVRMARRFPQILGMIADGRLHLSAVCLLSRHLTHENAAWLLEAATHRTKRQIEVMLAERFPQADVPTVVQAIVPEPGPRESAPGQDSDGRTPIMAEPARRPAPPDAPALHVAAQPDRTGGAAESPTAESVPGRILEARATAPSAPFPRVAPLSPQRYAVQFTMDQAMHDDLRRAQELLGHCVAPGEITGIFRRALRDLVVKLEKQKFAATSRPRPKAQPQAAAAPADPHYVPAHVRRDVWARDRGACTFVSDSGRPCAAREALEFDHVVPVAKGGTSTAENIRLRCRAHNQLEADRAFGEGFMHEIRERARGATAPASLP